MAPTALVVLTTLATDADARTLVTALLAERLIACGTLLPGGRSMYRWEGEVNEESEVVDRKSTRLNSSHTVISYAVFCLKKKIAKNKKTHRTHRAVEAGGGLLLVLLETTN